MRIRCPACASMYRVPDDRIPPQGARATCKSCGGRIDIPAPGSQPAPAGSFRTGTGFGPLPEDRQTLDDLLLMHQNLLASLRAQARQAGARVPFFVLSGIEHEMAEVRRVHDAIAVLGSPLWMRLRRLPEPGERADEDRVVERFPLLVGRSSVCDWRVDNPQISQFHGRLVVVGDEVCWQDLGSTNGGAVIREGTLVHRFELQPEDDGEVSHPPVALRPRDLLYVANTRFLIEEIGGMVDAGLEGAVSI